MEFTYVAGDLVDMVAVHELGSGGQGDELALGAVVLLFVAQLRSDTDKKEKSCAIALSMG